MPTLIFLNQNYLVQGETIRALRRIQGMKVVALDVTATPDSAQAKRVCEIIDQVHAQIVFTINEWGLDTEGLLSAFFNQKRVVHINWCVDDPFFEAVYHKNKFIPAALRFDFVSDKSYVPAMVEKGYQAFYLPLGTDPEIFYPTSTHYEYDISFVGNSYHQLISDFVVKFESFFDEQIQFLAQVISRYEKDSSVDIDQTIGSRFKDVNLPEGLSFEKAVFIAKHITGFLHRRTIISACAERFDTMVVFGDDGWKGVVKNHASGIIPYGEALRTIYQKSKINIDLNRIVIRNGVTQRVFDVGASGSFLITNYKPCIDDLFFTGPDLPEVVTFTTVDELFRLIDYYLYHDNERSLIASRAQKKISAMHTYDKRVDEIIRVVSSRLAILH